MSGLILALLIQQPPALERGAGFEFALPEGWTRQKHEDDKTVILLPPGSKGDVRLILYPRHPLSEGTYANEAHFHIAMLQALTEAGERRGEPATGKTGAFQWSRQNVVVDGSQVRVAAYTAKLRTDWCLVAFAGPAAAFDAHLETVERFVKELTDVAHGTALAAGTHAVHGLDLALPEGWTRKDDPGGAVALHPPGPKTEKDPAWDYLLLVLPTQPLRGTLWETQRAVFDELVQGSGLKKTVEPSHEPDAPGVFIRSSTAGDDARGGVRALRLYGALSEGGLEGVVVFGSEDYATTGDILRLSKVRKPPKEVARPRIVGAWRRLSQQTHVEYSRGQQLIIPVPYDRIWLRADGVADFSPLYREGYAVSRVPDKIGPGLENGRYGSWKDDRLTRKAGRPAETVVREGTSIRLGDKLYRPMPSVDGLRLEGRWHLPGADRKRRIEFSARGRFTDDGLLEDVGHLPTPAWGGGRVELYPRPPAAGTGTYEIRDFTMILTYDEGRVWSADFSIYGDDPKDLSRLLLKTGLLHRE